MASVFVLLEAFNRKEAAALGFFPCATASFGRGVIIGFQKTQIYQRFAGSRQEVFILKIQNSENNAAQQDNGRRFL